MNADFVYVSAPIAGAFAIVGIVGGVTGCLILVGIGLVALASLPRTGMLDDAASRQPQPLLPWLVCTAFFAFFVVLLAPFAQLPAVVVALLALSPLFGTLILTVVAAVRREPSRRN